MSEKLVNHKYDNAGLYIVPPEDNPNSNIGGKGSLSDARKVEGVYEGGVEVRAGNDLGMGACMGTNAKGRNA